MITREIWPQKACHNTGFRSLPKSWSFLGFTITEMLVVILVIMILLGLLAGVSKHVNLRASVSRTKADLKAIELALYTYKTDFGVFPSNPITFTPSSTTLTYQTNMGTNSNALYRALVYNNIFGATTSAVYIRPSYLPTLRLDQVNTGAISNTQSHTTHIIDSWGLPIGYDSASQMSVRRNPSFDLWSSGPDKKTSNRRRTDEGSSDPDNDDITNFNE